MLACYDVLVSYTPHQRDILNLFMKRMNMAKNCKIRQNRISFRCNCGKTIRASVAGHDRRRKAVLCDVCGKRHVCLIDHRTDNREHCSGTVTMRYASRQRSNDVIAVELINVSPKGVAFSLPLGARNTLRVGQKIHLVCPWNKRLLRHGSYVIKNINSHCVGARSVDHV